MRTQNEIEQLIYLFSKLPGLGTRSARRIVLHLLQEPEIRLRSFIEVLTKAESQISVCESCGNLDTIMPCKICSDESRDSSSVAIVETVADLWAMERSNIFKGQYHVLGGVLSAARGMSPDFLRLPQLLTRCKELEAKEIIIATNSTMEGQTTAFFITEYFKDQGFYISRLASGIPIGGELDYLDDGTLSAAFALRQRFGE
ncbi:MAG: recombination mediator RecR [Pseudomonadota bacterium]